MFNTKYKTDEVSTLSVLVFLYKWRKPYLYLGISSIIISLVVSLLIKPKYKSTVVLFPSTNVSASKALLAENRDANHDIGKFGEEEEAEQLLQILNSDEIRDIIIKKYNLAEHYGIAPDARYRYTKLINKYEDNISFKRTEFMSVKITVYDTDPEIAANIANDIAALSDSIHNKVVKQRAQKALSLVEKAYFDLKNEIKVDDDSLQKLRLLGINDYESQSERLNEGLSKAILEGKQNAIKIFEERLAILAKYGGAYVAIRDNLEHKRKQLNFIKARYEEAKLDVSQNLPYKFVVNNAYKAEKSSYPVIWLIVLLSFLGTIILLTLSIIFYENYQKLRK
jgi:uncharacterized protein involved in exopolysaccharide biosynthesis